MKLHKPLLKAIKSVNSSTAVPVAGDDIISWCENNCVIEGSVALTGPFRVATSRYMVEPLRAFQDWAVEEIVILKATQTGGSLCAQLMLE